MKMKHHNKNVAVFLIAALLMLSGCAENQIPELKDDEIQLIGEYVAITMMKYDLSHSSRLMDLTEEGMAGIALMPAVTPEPEETSGMGPVDDTPIVDSTGEIVDSAGETVTIKNDYTMEEVMGLPEGVTVAFLGQGTYSSYPEESDFFSVTASEGKKIVVLRFSLTNNSEQEQSVDLLSSGASYRITLNDNYSYNALTTGLLDDLSTYKGTLSAGGSAEAVLLIQVEESVSEEILSVGIIVRNDSKSYKAVL